ncbi:MAG: hypothetical protein IKE70_06405 [Bacilli bacterium]|nr:hypothetical protein [Bacilli bacterium]
MNKQNLWFLTLLSLILVLGVYYITMPSDLLEKVNTVLDEKKEKAVVEEVKEENSLTAMRVSKTEERNTEISVLKEQLTKEDLSTIEKNNLFEQLKYLNEVQGKEETLEKKIKKLHQLDCFIKTQKDNITTICISDKHDVALANKIMRTIQEEYQNKMNISVKFQKK